MNTYYFTEEHEMFRESLRSFLNKEVMPNIEQWEEDQRIPRDIWKKMGEMGFLGLGYPSEYGGMNLDFFYDVIFCEETSRMFSGGFTISQLVVQYMSGPYLIKHGSEQLKKKYLPGIISGDLISCIGISEPGAGSDVANIQTTAVREGDYYIVNGSKTFITNAVYGDFVVAVVKTDPKAGPAGVSLLIIDLDSPGITKTKLKKLGWHASDTAELAFDNVKVPVENLLGEEGQGFYYLMGGLQLERLAGAISAYAACESALEYTLQYMSERSAFGRPINKFQVLRHRIAQLASEIECTKQFILYCARLHSDKKYAVKECSMAKMLATELSDKVMTQCLQCFGGYGFMEEYKIARMFRDSRVGTIGGGTSEIMKEIIAKMIIDDVNYSSGAKRQTEMTSPEPKGIDFQKMLVNIQNNAASKKAIGKTLKFDFGDQQLFLDGTGETNIVSSENKDADCLVEVSLEDFLSLTKGQLEPMSAMMSGKIKIKGDLSVAMKLQTIFG
jgi:alkylation response protein AidB-like acyl-CoA dehydrogenase/putative sterol carrier protein